MHWQRWIREFETGRAKRQRLSRLKIIRPPGADQLAKLPCRFSYLFDFAQRSRLILRNAHLAVFEDLLVFGRLRRARAPANTAWPRAGSSAGESAIVRATISHARPNPSV